MISKAYGGKVPSTFEQLLKLPGVGRKSANLIMGDVFGKPAIVTDTHCIRLTSRTHLPAVVHQAVAEIAALLGGDDFPQSHFHLLGLLQVFYQSIWLWSGILTATDWERVL